MGSDSLITPPETEDRPTAPEALEKKSTVSTSKLMTLRDLVTTSVFSVIYFALSGIGALMSVVLPSIGVSIIVPVTALVAAPAFMVASAKVPKFGAITIIGIVMGAAFFVAGHMPVSWVVPIVFGLLADFIASIGHYRSKAWTLASFVVFAYATTGPVIPMYFTMEAYKESLLAKGKSLEYVTQVTAPISWTAFAIMLVVTFVCAILGGLLGQRLVTRHFVKAGLA
ncbi:MAG: MptD family putative ECF transporter S component [Actinomycetaceae bacterium]|nr:MptD family putative ECF transporter S component [Actinomycetaceae bacterium]